jgi:hypothetical protein
MTEPPSILRQSESTYHSELFTVRLWREQVNDHWEWRGKVQRIANNETRYFHGWEMLIATICEMLPADI